MNLYVCTLTFVGEADDADTFGERLLAALEGDKDALGRIHATTPPHVVKLGRVELESPE